MKVIYSFFLPHIYRAIDFNALVGSIGAYIGLFLGYSILQIPDFIQLISPQFKKYLAKRKTDVYIGVKHATNVHVQAAISENTKYGSQRTNPNSEILRIHVMLRMQSELENMSQRMDAIENFILNRL